VDAEAVLVHRRHQEEGTVNTTLFSQINYSTSRFAAMDSPSSSYYRGEMN
jgi:hypothetical protein